MWNYTRNRPTAVTLQNASPPEASFLRMPQDSFWKIPDSLCLGIRRTPNAKICKVKTSSLTPSGAPAPPASFSLFSGRARREGKEAQVLYHQHSYTPVKQTGEITC